MNDFKKPGRFSKGPRKPFNRGGRPDFGSRDREMFDAECSNCHKMTQVPFRPNGKKPVFCRDCFSQDGGSERTPRERFNSFDRPSARPERPFNRPQPDTRIDDMKRQLDAMNATLDRLVSLVEKNERSRSLTEEVEKHLPQRAVKKAPAKKSRAK